MPKGQYKNPIDRSKKIIARERLRAVETGVPVKEQRIDQMALFDKDNH